MAHREWKQTRELELRQLRRKQQKTTYELKKMEGVREKQDIVLRRKNEEVATARRRVKDLERQHTGSECNRRLSTVKEGVPWRGRAG